MAVMTMSHTTASGCAHVKAKSYGLIQCAMPGRCSVKIGAPMLGRRYARKRTPPAAMDAAEAGRPTMECIQPKRNPHVGPKPRSEEHTSELQSPCNLVCRLLLEKHQI